MAFTIPSRVCVRWVHPLLAGSVHYETEVTIHVSGGASFCIYKPKLVINVDEAGKILLGHPMSSQLKLDPRQIRVTSGVSQLPPNPSIAWERQRGQLVM
jgi:hypothetical protein